MGRVRHGGSPRAHCATARARPPVRVASSRPRGVRPGSDGCGATGRSEIGAARRTRPGDAAWRRRLRRAPRPRRRARIARERRTLIPAPVLAPDAAPDAANPLLAPWSAPHGLPPFADLRPEHFEPALRAAMAAHRGELAAIGANPAPPDFENTVAAFDRSGRLLARIESVYSALAASASSAELQAVQRALAAPLAAHESAVCMDPALFARLDALHAARERLGLRSDQRRLLERLHLDFVRAGARLAPPAQQRYAALMQELAELTTRFAQNLLHDESAFRLVLETEADRAGLGANELAATRQAAAALGLEGHAVTLSRSAVNAFLAASERRDLREQVWRAWVARGEHEGEHDNRPLVRRILELRAEQAALHGHASYADYALADTMAGKRARVQDLFDRVWPAALAAAGREQAMLAQVLGRHDLEPWDWLQGAETVRRREYALDEAELRPYFELDRVAAAAFESATRLFGLRFEPRPGWRVYHPDVRAYEVFDAEGAVRGVFLQDNFARAGKRSGAWMSALRWHSANGGRRLPIVLNNNNFAAAAPGAPVLLSLDDARTLFHEFGHALHGLLSEAQYDRLSGTQVLRDFVELPSQLFEHWIAEPELLRRHARHWQTGAPMPEALIERVAAASRFNEGCETLRYLASAVVDMALHALPAAGLPADVSAFEGALLESMGLPRAVGQNHRAVHFQHLFSGSGYAAGYYVYLWADVLAADAWAAFAAAGDPFDAALAQRLARWIYASGNAVAPEAAYIAFRGRAAEPGALLRERGLVGEA
ncbi:MAG: M3 family metallopeptidase, partial [Burkholderiales bacterium]|nr:M3 family metallopeptidase [Burkholderiales bacterium]